MSTDGTQAWADYDIDGLPAGSFIGWTADGLGPVFGHGGERQPLRLRRRFGHRRGRRADAPGRWSAPLPFTDTCDASTIAEFE